MAFLIDPRGIDFLSWACFTAETFTGLHVEYPTESTDWRQWGRNFAGTPAFATVDIPDTEQFESWEEWASWVVHLTQDIEEEL